jgi:hypothetical protein
MTLTAAFNLENHLANQAGVILERNVEFVAVPK